MHIINYAIIAKLTNINNNVGNKLEPERKFNIRCNINAVKCKRIVLTDGSQQILICR